MRVRGALFLALAGACTDPPRQDLRDQQPTGAAGDINAAVGMTPAALSVAPGAPAQHICIHVTGMGSGWVELHRQPGWLGALLHQPPRALHVQPFTGEDVVVVAPADLRGPVSLQISNVSPGHPPPPGTRISAIESMTLVLDGEDVELNVIARDMIMEELRPHP